MKPLIVPFMLLASALAAIAQGDTETTPKAGTTKWDVEIPQPITDGTPLKPVEKQEPIDFKIITSRTKQMDVVKAPEMPDLPPITGRINVTVRMVEDPDLPAPREPLPALEPDDPVVIEKMDELWEKYQGTSLVFISATVYDHNRTLLRVQTYAGAGGEVTAWSNLDFNHFSGFSLYRVKDGIDGTLYEYGLLMGLGNEDTIAMTEIDSRSDMKYEAPEIPKLPDLAKDGPEFVIVEGKEDSPAVDTLEQMHDLYRKEGARMEAAYHAREKSRAERKAYLLANPPVPADVTISFWKKSERPAATTKQSTGEKSR